LLTSWQPSRAGEAAERRKYRARLVVERLTGKAVQTFQNAAMKQGTEREPFARDAYEVRTGNWSIRSGCACTTP
jgi:hypothetical protein